MKPNAGFASYLFNKWQIGLVPEQLFVIQLVYRTLVMSQRICQVAKEIFCQVEHFFVGGTPVDGCYTKQNQKNGVYVSVSGGQTRYWQLQYILNNSFIVSYPSEFVQNTSKRIVFFSQMFEIWLLVLSNLWKSRVIWG